MARPSVVTPELRAAAERHADLPAAQLHRALLAEGHRVSLATVSRLRAGRYDGPSAAPAPAGALAGGANDLTPAGMADELRRRYVEVRQVVESVRSEAMTGGPALSRWLRSVHELGELAERLARMVPPPAPDPETDPANVAAKARLLARVDEVLARG